MTKRLVVVVALACLGALVAFLVLRDPGSPSAGNGPTLQEMAADLGAGPMTLLVRGHVPGTSGDIAIVPRPHRFMGSEWDLSTIDTETPDPETSHPNPWDYLVRVPLVFYGPGLVPSGREIDRPTDVTALAPTYASMLSVEGLEADSEPLPELAAAGPPRVIATVVVDGGGWNVLQRHPAAWPEMRAMMEEGTVYSNALVGSVPSVTAPVHTNMGTGAYPRSHGVANNPVLSSGDPGRIEVPTVSDLWGAQTDDRAVTAMVAYEDIHLGMLGHGADRDGGDQDVAVMWGPQERWRTSEPFFRLPSYLDEPGEPTLRAAEEELDERDGLEDGTWFGITLSELRSSVYRTGTPAFVRMTGDAISEVLVGEGVGADDITDLLWIELKSPDYTAHAWGMSHPAMADTMSEVDAQIGRLKRELEELVGPGGYIIAITADHGLQPLPNEVGGWQINAQELTADLVAEFGDVIDKVTPTDIRLSNDALEDGVDLEAIAGFIGTYTIGDNIPEGAEGSDRVSPARLDEKLFAGAFTSEFLQGLSSRDIAALGQGRYPEGDYEVTNTP